MSEAQINTTDATATPEVAAPVLTRADKLRAEINAIVTQSAALGLKYAAKKKEYDSLAFFDALKEGDQVDARVGRGDTAKRVIATILGIQTDEKGVTRYKIQYGQGFDADQAVVFAASIEGAVTPPPVAETPAA